MAMYANFLPSKSHHKDNSLDAFFLFNSPEMTLNQCPLGGNLVYHSNIKPFVYLNLHPCFCDLNPFYFGLVWSGKRQASIITHTVFFLYSKPVEFLMHLLFKELKTNID